MGISDELFTGVKNAASVPLGKVIRAHGGPERFFTDFKNTSFQDNANEAIHHFIK